MHIKQVISTTPSFFKRWSAGAKLIQSQEPGTSYMGAEAQGCNSSFAAFPGYKHRTGLEEKQLELQQVPMWDAWTIEA